MFKKWFRRPAWAPDLIALPYWLGNLPANVAYWLLTRLTLLFPVAGATRYEGRLYATLRKADGREIYLGLLSNRLVTDVGVAYIVDCFNPASGAELENFNYHIVGVGTGSENVADTTATFNLTGSPTATTAAGGTRSEAAANIYQTTATIPFTSNLPITEHGVVNSATVAGSVLLDRSKFLPLNTENGDTITWQYQLSVLSGG